LSLAKRKEAEFSFFFLSHRHTLSLALLVEKKKKRKECIEVALPAATIFFCDYPFCRTEPRVNEEQKKEREKCRVHASDRTVTYFRRCSMYMRQKNINHIRSSNISCLCLENRQL